jgi:hypothetical protein
MYYDVILYLRSSSETGVLSGIEKSYFIDAMQSIYRTKQMLHIMNIYICINQSRNELKSFEKALRDVAQPKLVRGK